MVEVLPITLKGENLGKRHHYLNVLLNSAFEQNLPLQSVLDLPEKTPIDRIFKIDFASKYKNVDFVLNNLKQDDMLYVSRALKCKWLLDDEYGDIINPEYLENHLYPEMTAPAVNKMKNWIELNLKQPKRCQVFYEYYKNDFGVAIKFLRRCPQELILEQILNVMDRLTPKHLNMLCETCPQVAKAYFDGLQNNKKALLQYNDSQRDYFKSIMNVLKLDGDLFLDLVEKYFDNRSLNRLSLLATKYIMKNYKSRYLNKPELYAGWILNIKTLALFLNSEEIQDIVKRLARAQYLGYTFTYKIAEPLIKCLHGEERASMKKKIFVDKSFGNYIDSWPYPPPEGLKFQPEYDFEIFNDVNHHPYEYDHLKNIQVKCKFSNEFRCMKRLKKRSGKDIMMQSMACRGRNSSLDTLFNRYRFDNFDKVLFEFRKLLLTEGTIEGRRNMILVMVSKTGGSEAKVEQLLNLLVERHSNEPENLRDAVARSMVKRAFAWRLSTRTWELLLKWASTSVREILHTTILRHLLENTPCPPAQLAAYLLDFSDFTEYSLNIAEKSSVAERLPALLVSANAPKRLLATLKAYNVHVDSVPGANNMFMTAARQDEDVLRSMFKSRVARRHLLEDSFKVIQTDDSYMNALRHDITVLKDGDRFVDLISKEKINHDRFLRALTVYFSEPDGQAARHLTALEKAIDSYIAIGKCRESFARPLAFLVRFGDKSLKDYLYETQKKSGAQKKFAAALRANAFVARPMIDIDNIDWNVLGSKLVSNKVLQCCDEDLNKYIQKCLKWKKTMRVALRLANRSNSVSDVLSDVIEKRPTVALKVFISDVNQNRQVDIIFWNQVKAIILSLDLSKATLIHVRNGLKNLNVLSSIEADYWTSTFEAFRKDSELAAMPMLCRMENVLTELDDIALKRIISDFLRDKLNKDIIAKEDLPKECICLYFRIIAKYLLISKSVDDQKAKIETVCEPFFEKMQTVLEESKDSSDILECLDDFLTSLKYNKVFLNTKYVCCIPMFEKILEHLHKILPREKYFKKYVCIHVIMLYYRSIRQTLKQKPEFIENPKLIHDEGVQTVGFVLGKYIGIEIDDLVKNYFRSIVEIYQRGLFEFFTNFEYTQSREKLVTSVIRGLMEKSGHSQLLAQYLFSKGLIHKEHDEILKLLKDANNKEMEFFLNADIYPY